MKFSVLMSIYHKEKVKYFNKAILYRIFSLKSYLISFIFACKKYKLSNYSLFRFYILMLKGIRECKNEK